MDVHGGKGCRWDLTTDATNGYVHVHVTFLTVYAFLFNYLFTCQVFFFYFIFYFLFFYRLKIDSYLFDYRKILDSSRHNGFSPMWSVRRATDSISPNVSNRLVMLVYVRTLEEIVPIGQR